MFIDQEMLRDIPSSSRFQGKNIFLKKKASSDLERYSEKWHFYVKKQEPSFVLENDTNQSQLTIAMQQFLIQGGGIYYCYFSEMNKQISCILMRPKNVLSPLLSVNEQQGDIVVQNLFSPILNIFRHISKKHYPLRTELQSNEMGSSSDYSSAHIYPIL